MGFANREFGHLEMVGQMIEAHTRGLKPAPGTDSSLFAVRGKGPHFLDSQGAAWTASYINEGGDVVRDLRAGIAAEAGARQTYEALINVAPDEGSKKALIHLVTREIAHTHMFMMALESLGKPTEPLFGNAQPDKTVNLYYHLSSDGKKARGPWNEAPTFKCIADPVQMWFFWMSSRRSAASSSIGLLS
jgi:Mn-containing catalase